MRVDFAPVLAVLEAGQSQSTESGDGGGLVLYEGVPEGLVKVKESFTGKFLKAELN